MACSEIAATEVWRSVGLEPGDIVEYVITRQLQGIAALINGVISSADPDGAVWL